MGVLSIALLLAPAARVSSDRLRRALDFADSVVRLLGAETFGRIVPDLLDVGLRARREQQRYHRVRGAPARLHPRNASKSNGVGGPLSSPSISAARNAASRASCSSSNLRPARTTSLADP